MVDFLKRRLQVFVSSTFTDLREDRQAAVEAILSSGHIPAGMELFAAGDESQMEVIKQWIDESDAYLLILGGRYGSIDPHSRKSYTQLEYEYAIRKGKPVFACVMTDRALDERTKKVGKEVLELENPQKLKAFRRQVLKKISKLCEDSKDIKIAVVDKLASIARREDLVGWVKPNTQANVPALADEVVRLSQENAQLRSDLALRQETLIAGIPYSDMKNLASRKESIEFLRHNRRWLARGDYAAQVPLSETIEELLFLGLIERGLSIHPPHFKLTDAGALFVAKLEAETLKDSTSQKATESRHKR